MKRMKKTSLEHIVRLRLVHFTIFTAIQHLNLPDVTMTRYTITIQNFPVINKLMTVTSSSSCFDMKVDFVITERVAASKFIVSCCIGQLAKSDIL